MFPKVGNPGKGVLCPSNAGGKFRYQQCALSFGIYNREFLGYDTESRLSYIFLSLLESFERNDIQLLYSVPERLWIAVKKRTSVKSLKKGPLRHMLRGNRIFLHEAP
jgi:hypothetical protein